MIYLDLFLGFLKVGLFSFGGAYGAIPLIRDVVLSYGWMNEEALTYMIAVSESTPGPIMVNLATYAGSDQGGIIGAMVATFAVVLPAFIIILLITALLNNVLKNKYVQAVLMGLKPCVVGIVLAVGVYMTAGNCLTEGRKINVQAVIITVSLVIIAAVYKYLAKKKIPPVTMIIISSLLGILVYAV